MPLVRLAVEAETKGGKLSPEHGTLREAMESESEESFAHKMAHLSQIVQMQAVVENFSHAAVS